MLYDPKQNDKKKHDFYSNQIHLDLTMLTYAL